MRPIAFATLLSATIIVPAHANFEDGNSLLNFCETAKQTCFGYIAGATDVLSQDPHICLPKNVTVRQISDLVQQKPLRFPETRNQPATIMIRAVLTVYFPCK